MTQISPRFDEVPPPSRPRRQLLVAAVASLALVAGGISVAVGLNLAGAGRPSAVTTSPGPLVWAGRGDATHLYRVTNICGQNPRMQVSPSISTSPAPSEPWCNELWASADGGATWSSRGVSETDTVRVVGPQRLLRYRAPSMTSPASEPGLPYELSTDAGATWAALPPNGPPLDTFPRNGLMMMRRVAETSLWVYDPSQGRVRPMAGPSWDFARDAPANSTGPASALWFGGIDPATGRPALVVAQPGDRTWIPRLLPNVTPVIDPSALQAARSSGSSSLPDARATYILQIIPGADGRKAYVTMYDIEAPQPTSYPAISGTPFLSFLRGFYTADGGTTWQEVGHGASVPGSWQGWVTADGRLVLLIDVNDPAGGEARTHEFVVGGPDGRFTMAAPPGLPTDLINVDSAVAYTDHAMYVSDDGWTWREAWHD